ncbi:MAG: hypothetical protein HY700_19620 [Gemmatimonadetes bacterium]|nr:hypothetical protein [Gemmatimonadota bacterium]
MPAGIAAALLFLVGVHCAPDSMVEPEPPSLPPCVETLKIVSFGGSFIVGGRAVAILGADVRFGAIGAWCGDGPPPPPTWSVDDTSVIRDSGSGEYHPTYTAIAVGTATITAQRGSLRATLPVDVPAPPSIGRLVHVSAGYLSTCALNQFQQTFCWGDNRYQIVAASDAGVTGQCDEDRAISPCRPVPALRPLPVTLDQLDARSAHVCGLAAGTAWCWGSNYGGQTGQIPTSHEGIYSSFPQTVPGGVRFSEVSAGWAHTCGLAGQTAYCWGDNFYGQLGNGSRVRTSQPVRVAGAQRFAAMAAGSVSTCALTIEGAPYCWGRVLEGAGPSQTCATVGTTMHPFCWLVPTRVNLALAGTDTVFRSISLGMHACAISTSGRAYCWGGLGIYLGVDPDNLWVPSPAPVETSLRFQSISVGGGHACAVIPSGTAYCWGGHTAGVRGVEGQLGDGTMELRLRPVSVTGGLSFQSVVAGNDHTCGITLKGIGYCWGSNRLGQLGTGSQRLSMVPVPILGQ